MTETPKTREELEDALLRLPGMTETRVHDLLALINRRGLRIVPVEATQEMLVRGCHTQMDMSRKCWAAMLAKNPFDPEDPNG